MPNFALQILANSGAAMIADALTGKVLTFTRIGVGSGTFAGDPKTLTALVTPQLNAGITAISRDDANPGLVRVRGIFTNKDLTTGFTFREMGLFARIDSGPEQLYSWTADAAGGDFIPAYDGHNPVIVYPTILILLSSDIPLHADIVIGADFNAENIGPPSAGAGVFAQRAGNTFQFKRLVAGTGLEISEDANRITIGESVLTQDLDLYVSPPANDISPNFTTLQRAHDYLLDFRIPAGRRATINISGDTYTSPAITRFVHADSMQIQVVGAPRQARQLTAMSATKVATLAAGAALTVGRVVFVAYQPDHAGPNILDSILGACRATAVAGNNITLSQHHAGNPIPYAQTGIVGGQLAWFPTTFQNSTILFERGIGLLRNITFENGSSLNHNRGVEVWADQSNLQNLVFIGCEMGLMLNGGSAGAISDGPGQYNEMMFADCSSGIEIGPQCNYGSFMWDGLTVFNGNYNAIRADQGTLQLGGHQNLWFAHNSNQDSIVLSMSKAMLREGWFGYGNRDVVASMGSTATISSGAGNGWIEANGMSYVYVASAANFTNLFPAANTVGNANSYIQR